MSGAQHSTNIANMQLWNYQLEKSCTESTHKLRWINWQRGFTHHLIFTVCVSGTRWSGWAWLCLADRALAVDDQDLKHGGCWDLICQDRVPTTSTNIVESCWLAETLRHVICQGQRRQISVKNCKSNFDGLELDQGPSRLREFIRQSSGSIWYLSREAFMVTNRVSNRLG